MLFAGLELYTSLTAAWLAQLVEGQFAVREVEGSSPRQTGPTLRVLKCNYICKWLDILLG